MSPKGVAYFKLSNGSKMRYSKIKMYYTSFAAKSYIGQWYVLLIRLLLVHVSGIFVMNCHVYPISVLMLDM